MAKKKVIDQKAFESLCAIQCTELEICAVLDISDQTLNEWCKTNYGKTFMEVYNQKRAGGKMSMRRKQLKLAESSPAMSIWLGKQYLEQREPLTELDMAKIEREKAHTELVKAQTELLRAGNGGDVIQVKIVEDLKA